MWVEQEILCCKLSLASMDPCLDNKKPMKGFTTKETLILVKLTLDTVQTRCILVYCVRQKEDNNPICDDYRNKYGIWLSKIFFSMVTDGWCTTSTHYYGMFVNFAKNNHLHLFWNNQNMLYLVDKISISYRKKLYDGPRELEWYGTRMYFSTQVPTSSRGD